MPPKIPVSLSTVASNIDAYLLAARKSLTDAEVAIGTARGQLDAVQGLHDRLWAMMVEEHQTGATL